MGAMLGEEISGKVNAFLGTKDKIKLLEAGCGSASYFKFKPAVYSVGIDISQQQLDRNAVIQEKILGDLQTYPLPKEEFDVVVCWDVIEHLPRPQEALQNMFQAARPGGFVILGFPNLGSFKGVVTKFTPFWFHVAFYRLMKYKSRPFHTYLRFAVLPGRVTAFAVQSGFEVIYSRLVEGGMTRKFRERFWVAKVILGCVDGLTRVLSLGRVQSLYNDGCALILRKAPRQVGQ